MSRIDHPILVTGGAGFIGSAVVRALLRETAALVVTLDKLTYAGNLDSLREVAGDPRHVFVRADVCDADAVRAVFETHGPAAVIHLAAESHVDRSIDGPADFLGTNVAGTFTLLEEARRYLGGTGESLQGAFRFLHVSTDEVYGSLGATGRFDECSPYAPRSPYAATKAASDHLVRAWHHTYGLPILLTNCSNNYGPYQFPEKLIPLTILNALEARPLPVYGRGENVRDWLHVDDHAAALVRALTRGRVGETYLIGGDSERRNIDVVRGICAALEELQLQPRPDGGYEKLIRFVEDRPGHDHRYAIDATRTRRELDWRPRRSFEDGLRQTVAWYVENRWWWERVRSGAYRGERLGLGVHPAQ